MKGTLASRFPIRKKYNLKIGQYPLTLGEHTRIMGIINATPDSFSNDGCLDCHKKENFLTRTFYLGKKFVKQGADIIDIGGESTRPGSKKIPVKEEINRVIPVIRLLAKKIAVPISVDTYKPEVAKHALDAGAGIVNNIMGIKPETRLLKMIKNYNACIILMHIKGIPLTMQKKASYKTLIPEIINALKKSIEKCLEIGIKSDKIIIDPGIGFGKTVENNLEIINRLDNFRILKKPLLIGTSRKSFIGKTLNKNVNARLMGTVASVCASILKGAHIVRVHDVTAIKEIAAMTDAIMNEKIKDIPL